MGSLIRNRTPDKNGKALPLDIGGGSYQFRDLTDHGVGSLFEGKVVYDTTYGQVTYGCALCCGYNSAFLSVNPLDIPLQFTAGNGVESWDTCWGTWDDVSDSFYNNWSTANPSIAKVDSYGTHTGMAVGSTNSVTSGLLPWYNQRCYMRNRIPGGTDSVIQLDVTDRGYILVGTDQNLRGANAFFATVSPSGGTLTGNSSDTKDTFTSVQSAGPGLYVTTTDQSQSVGDRQLTFTYSVNSDSVERTVNETAREFAWVKNNNPSNSCGLGYGYTYAYTYTPYTHPDGGAVPPSIGIDGTAVTESFNPPTIACGNETGNGSLNPNSQFIDTIAFCSNAPLPTCSSTNTQTFKIAGYQVRQNRLTIANTGLTYINQGPTQ